MLKITKKSLLLLLVVVLVAAFACSCGTEKNPAETTKPTVTDPVATDPAVTNPVTTDSGAQRPEEINYKDYYPLYVQDGLIYHINFAGTSSDPNEYIGKSRARYYPFYATIDEFKIGDTWWDGFQCSIHDGYIDMAINNSIYFYSTEINAAIQASKQCSVELVLSAEANSSASFGVGPDLRLNVGGDRSASFAVDRWGYMLKNPSALSAGETVDYTKDSLTLTMAVDGTKINTYVFSMDMASLEQTYRYSYTVYANGTNYGERANILSPTNTFSPWGQMPLRKGAMHLHAMRVYDKSLSEAEALQNHFMDVAMLNGFDLAEFKELDDAKKLSVYKAFKNYVADEDYGILIKAFADAMAEVK